VKRHEFDRIVNKLQLTTRNSGDRLAWFEYEGKIITRTKLSHGKGDLPCGDQIRQQLKLNEDQLRGLIDCNISLENYVDILRKKNLI
jgi:hypothetical protein